MVTRFKPTTSFRMEISIKGKSTLFQFPKKLFFSVFEKVYYVSVPEITVSCFSSRKYCIMFQFQSRKKTCFSFKTQGAPNKHLFCHFLCFVPLEIILLILENHCCCGGIKPSNRTAIVQHGSVGLFSYCSVILCKYNLKLLVLSKAQSMN